MKAPIIKHACFAVPGDLTTPTGGYAYDARIIAGLRARGWTIDVIDLGAHYPRPDAAALARARQILAQAPDGEPLVIDGLAFGVMPQIAQALQISRRLVALVHHPLAFESGLSEADAASFRSSEHAALSFAHHVIVTSPATGRLLNSDYAVPEHKITIARPGNDRVAHAMLDASKTPNAPLRLLSVGAIVQRKGYDVLLDALATLKDLPWRLTIVGDPTRDVAAAARLSADIGRHNLDARVQVAGAVSPERLAALYAEANLFVLASRFEGYGMAYAEAIAHGLPVIGTIAGAIPDTLADAGLLVPPDDVAALADALQRVIGDTSLRARLAAAAREAKLPTWDESVEEFARVLETV